MKILAIGAHPDDVEFGCGGTLLLLKQIGHNVNLVDLTKGEAAKYGANKRLMEAINASKILGMPREILDWGDKKIFNNPVFLEKVQQLVERYSPDLIFAPYFKDTHSDHVNAGNLFATSPNVIHYFISTVENPTHGVDVTDVYSHKNQALDAHVSQIRPGDLEWTENRHRENGIRIGRTYGELFYIPNSTLNLPSIFKPI